MGSGEPLDNYDNVVRFLHRVTAPDGMHVSARNISVSTCGIPPMMDRFAGDAPHVTLSVSLHAHTDAQRSAIMPVNRRYPLADVLSAAKRYAEATGRRVVFEYILITGVNAARRDAQALAERLRGILCHVNLIPLNSVPERGFTGSPRGRVRAFHAKLAELGISATIRRSLADDVAGACGQLRASSRQENAETSTED
jgi:23S rRNA (adenine2503-C2)-methyltransferase